MNELDEEARALIDLARDADDPSATDRMRVRQRIIAAGAAGVLGAAAPVAKAGAALGGASGAAALGSTAAVAAGSKGLTVTIVGLAAGVAVAGSALVAVTIDRPTDPAPPSVASTVEPAEPSPVSAAPKAVRAEEQSARKAEAPPAPALPTAPAKVRASVLADETRLLQAARAALSRGDAAEALALAETHQRRFPNGALTEEAEATRILGLCARGDTDSAAAAGRAFLRRHPSSPLRARILASCAGEPAGVSVTDTRGGGHSPSEESNR